MKSLAIAFVLSVGIVGIAHAQSASTSVAISAAKHKGAPAPEIGGGVTGLLVVGGLLLGAGLLARSRRA